MKGRVNGFISGVLFTLVFVSLIGTAFAAKGRISIQADYNDIRVTLDGQAVELVDANGNAVEPFAINGTTYLPVRAVASALGLEVGWDQETATVQLQTENYRPQRNGFNNITNQKVKWGSYEFSLPSYWEEDGSNDKYYRYYAETGRGVSMLMIQDTKIESFSEYSFHTLSQVKDSFMKGFLSKFKEATVLESNVVTNNQGDISGFLYRFSFILDVDGVDYPGIGELFIFPDTEDGKFVSIGVVVCDYSKYVYDDDFSKIIDSIRVESASNPTIQGNTTDTPSGSSPSSRPNNDNNDMPDGSRMVYVTSTGSRYHYDSTCNGGKYTLTTLENAQRRGLSPCQKCVLH